MSEKESAKSANLFFYRSLIKIYFYKDLDVEKEFFVGRSFIMSEGGFETGFIGKGVITEIIGIEKI
jgi:hypothetical protein